MAYTTIDDPSAFFQTALYTGTGSTQSITNDGNSDLQPDWVWVKKRNATESHALADSSRGTSATLFSDSTATESSSSQVVNAFNSDGFQVGTEGVVNDNTNTYVAWQWKAGGGTTSSNSDGNITTTLQTNSTAGFTIGTYTGDGGGSATIGHGLGAIPDLVIIKGRDGSGLGGAAQYWVVGAPNTEAFGNGGSKYMFLDGNAAVGTNTTMWRNANFTSTIIPMGGHAAINGNGAAYVFYAFKNIQGYSKIGQYEGNGQRDGAFVYLGFQPAFVMIKNIDGSGRWTMFDNKRTIANGDFEYLVADDNHAESDTGLGYTDPIDFLSNGFKQKNSDAFTNASSTYLYWAFAQHPFVTSTGIPITAR